jgi:hypothetical protein
LQISSNFAVLVGVVLVIVQLRQNAELLELQILKQDTDSYIENEIAMLPENYTEIWAKMILEPENLTLSEFRAIDSHFWAQNISRWRNLYDLYERGLLDSTAWRRLVSDDVEIEFAHPYGRWYWNSVVESEENLPPELVEFVSSLLAEAPDNYALIDFQNMKRDIGASRVPETRN